MIHGALVHLAYDMVWSAHATQPFLSFLQGTQDPQGMTSPRGCSAQMDVQSGIARALAFSRECATQLRESSDIVTAILLFFGCHVELMESLGCTSEGDDVGVQAKMFASSCTTVVHILGNW